jgi:hypothetical protein
MAQPTKYTRSYDFTAFSALYPSDQQPGAQIDNELNNVVTSVGQICDNLALIQRDDGLLGNDTVNVDQLSDTVIALIGSGGFKVRGPWVSLTSYALGDLVTSSSSTYLCAIAHTAGVFATDVAANKFVLIFNASLTAELALKMNIADLAASSGSSLVGHIASGTGAVARTAQSKLRDFVSVNDFSGVDPTGTTDSYAGIQACFDAYPNGNINFNGTYKVSASILLTTAAGRNFQGSITGNNSTVTFTTPGGTTDSDTAMQRGFAAYPVTNASGGDITGLRDVVVRDLNIVGPANGSSFHIANSQGVVFDHVSTKTNRYGISNECCINVVYNSCKFEDSKNAGVGLVMLSDTSRVWYGSASPSTSYWNDSPTFVGCKFLNSLVTQPLAHVLDHGSQSESIRLMQGCFIYSRWDGSGAFISTQYGIVCRNGNWSLDRSWFENVAYPIRVLESAAVEGTGNLPGVAAAQPSGTYSLSNFVDGYSYNLDVRGCDFVRGFNDINLSGIRGNVRLGANRSLFLQAGGLHIKSISTVTTQVVLDDPATLITPGAGYAYSSFVSGQYVNTANVLTTTAWTPTVTAGTGTITTYVINSAKYQQRGKWIEGHADITITTNGTGAGSIKVTPPVNPITNGGVAMGRETVNTGSLIGGEVNGGQILLVTYNNLYPAANGSRLVFSFAYEAA